MGVRNFPQPTPCRLLYLALFRLKASLTGRFHPAGLSVLVHQHDPNDHRFLLAIQCCLTDFQIVGYISVRFIFRIELRGLLKLAHDLFWGVLFKLLLH